MGLKSLYVHNELLEWFENLLVNFLPQEPNIVVEEICHHAFDDNIKHIVSDRSGDNVELLMECLLRSKYQLFWLSETTYFIEIDQFTEKLAIDLENQFNEQNVLKFLSKRYERQVNWLTFESILVFEFEDNVDEETFRAIDEIFRKNLSFNKKPRSLFLEEVLPWHRSEHNYIDIDTLALDVCGEEWIHYNLLKDFSLEDLLCIELANKDFRQPYFDQYLDNYLQRCITKKLPFNIDFESKIEFPLPYFDYRTITGYFIYKYHKYFSTLYMSDGEYKIEFDVVAQILNISNFEYLEERWINLDKNDIDIEEIIKLCKPVPVVIYEISIDYNITNDLFVRLLKLPNTRQMYTFNCSDEITFEAPIFTEKIDSISAVIELNITDSSAQNSTKLGNLIRYFTQLFKDVTDNVTYYISGCVLTDFSVFENVGRSKLILDEMKIDHVQLLTLASNLISTTRLKLSNCNELHDANIMDLIKQSKLNPKRLKIMGESSCTFLLYFMIAEHLISTQDCIGLSIPDQKMPKIEKFFHFFQDDQLEFFESDGMILLRNSLSKDTIDTYSLLNKITSEEEPLFVYD